MARQLYELVGTDPARRFSPFCWRSRMALAHKGLDAEVVPWRFTENARLTALGGKTALVTAMLASKDSVGFFMPFRYLKPPVFTLPNAPGHLGAEPIRLADAAHTAGLHAEPCDSLEAAMGAAAASGADRILICGSLYLAGIVLGANDEAPE